MRTVDDGAFVPPLKARGPIDRRQTLSNRLFADLEFRGANAAIATSDAFCFWCAPARASGDLS